MKIKLLKGATILDPIPTGRRSDGEVGKLFIARDSGGVHNLISGTTGSGKALKTDTPIPTRTGWQTGWTTMGDLQVGDQVLGPDKVPCTVTGAFDVMHDRPCYDVVFSDGAMITADSGHLWLTHDGLTQRVRTTADIAQDLCDATGQPKHSVPESMCSRTEPRTITDVRPVPSVPVRCIRVDSASHLFLAGPTMIPTHNTYGEIPVLLTCGALQVDQILIDTVKGVQSYQDVAGCLQMYEIDPGRAKQLLKRLLNKTLPARTNHLAREGLRQWSPKSSLRFLRIHIEEAWTIAEAKEIVGLAVALRSAGGQLTYSVQQPTWDNIPTTVRNQMGSYRAYGITDSDYDEYSLPEDVIAAGAKPSQWGNEDPGMHYLVGPKMTVREKVMEHRSWSDGTGENSFASAAAYVTANLRPMCPVTAESLGDLWDTHIPPLELVKQVGFIVPGPVAGPALAAAAQATAPTRPVDPYTDSDEDLDDGDDDFDETDAEFLAAIEELYADEPELEETDLDIIGDRIIVTNEDGDVDFELDASDLDDDGEDDGIPGDDEPTHPTVARMIGDPPKDGLTPEEFRQVLTEVVTEFLTSGQDRLEANSFLNILADAGWSRPSLYKYMSRDPRITKVDRGWVPAGNTDQRNEDAA